MSVGGRRTVLIEFVRVGAYVKVSAVDERTGTEVSIVGDPSRSEDYLKRLVTRKLERALERQARERMPGRS